MAQFSNNYRTFYQKNCQKALKNMVLGSGIRKNLFRIPDPGVKKAPDPGSATLRGGVYPPPPPHTHTQTLQQHKLYKDDFASVQLLPRNSDRTFCQSEGYTKPHGLCLWYTLQTSVPDPDSNTDTHVFRPDQKHGSADPEHWYRLIVPSPTGNLPSY